MDIFINSKSADITLDTEKTLGDVLSGIEMWISPTRNRIQGIKIDGKDPGEENLGLEFSRDIKNIKRLDIAILPYRDLAIEALEYCLKACQDYEKSAFEERKQIASAWEKNAAGRFMASDIPDIYKLAARTFSGEGPAPAALASMLGERLREFADPEGEIINAAALVESVAGRMEDISLDIQTGKDRRAADTIQLFSGLGEKLFRLFGILESEGLSIDTFVVGDMPAKVFFNELNAALRELSAAYENKDTVLVGDISEYELAPRLKKLYAALEEIAGK